MIKSALGSSTDTKVRTAQVFAKGSVKAKTNIRNGSDIDICVMPRGVFYADYPAGMGHDNFGNSSTEYTYDIFRIRVLRELQEAFGHQVEDGNKALKIRGTFSGSRIDADVVPAFEHKRYRKLGVSPEIGIEFRAKTGTYIINWPHHNYSNTVQKHDETYRRHRKMVRILKNSRVAMAENGYSSADKVYSFLIESLVWNAPNHFFGNNLYEKDIEGILGFLITHTATPGLCSEWGEVNELKYLFRPSQKWTREDAHKFLSDARLYIGGLR